MRNFLILLIFIWFFNLLLNWWVSVIPAIFFGAWLFDKNLSALIVGFLAGGTAWFIHALYIHISNDAILATRIADMMQVGSPLLVLILTFIVGGLLTAISTLMGYQIKALLKPTK